MAQLEQSPVCQRQGIDAGADGQPGQYAVGNVDGCVRIVTWPGVQNGSPFDQVFNSGTILPINSNTPAATPATPLPRGEFSHLPNVFHSPRIYWDSTNSKWSHGDGTAVTPNPLPSPNLFRLFEYVHVPSRFVGTEDWLPPGSYSYGDGMLLTIRSTHRATSGIPSGGGTIPNLPTHRYHPPFNRVSRFREPGKVNINTIFDPFVWRGSWTRRIPMTRAPHPGGTCTN